MAKVFARFMARENYSLMKYLKFRWSVLAQELLSKL
jgi:hypothetical protein